MRTGFAWSIPIRWKAPTPATRDLGYLGVGESGSVTFTLDAGFYVPIDRLITTTVQIADTAGATEVITDNNTASVTSPIQIDYVAVPDLPHVSIPEGMVVTNTGHMVWSAGNKPDGLGVYPPPSVGEIPLNSLDNVNLTWTWIYTTTDGPR